MKKELTIKDIVYKFKTEEIEENERGLSFPQYEEVYEQVKTALEIRKEGFNVYIIDDFSKEKLCHLKEHIENCFDGREKPKDICYVIEEEEKYPKVLFLQNGMGKIFKERVDQLKEAYLENIFQFYNNGSSKGREKILADIQKEKSQLVEKIVKMAQDEGFDLKSTKEGFLFVPIKEGKFMSEKEYDELEYKEKEELIEKVDKLKETTQDIIEAVKNIEIEQVDKIKELMSEYYKEQRAGIREIYEEEFKEEEKALQYFEKICNEIEEGVLQNCSIYYDEDEEKINELIDKYAVMVLVDNEGKEKPPVIFEEDPNITNLLGCVEYENHNGTYTTDITLIQAGSLIQANGGCLITKASNLFSNPSAYYYLKKCLLSEKVDLDYNRGYLELLSLGGMKPEPIPIHTKVILIGDYESYELLYNYDEDFRKIFKIRAESNLLQELNGSSRRALSAHIYNLQRDNQLKEITPDAVKEIAKYLSRKAESRNKIFFDELELSKIVMIANNNVVNDKREKIEKRDIQQIAFHEEQIEKEVLREYKEKKIFLSVKGEAVGQINGLSVIDAGYHRFGRPIKITCCCYKGDGNIFDVHKESELSGNIHRKSVHVIMGYLHKCLGEYNKIPVDFHLSFEQLYGKLEGDSASVAEVVCMLSALSKIPIRQWIAVTGSINQFGEVQPIGGVNEKIEGFYKVCNTIDDKGTYAVLIPNSNKDDLILCEEVEEAVKSGKFHIYTMETIEDALEVLMGNSVVTVKDIFTFISREMKRYTSKK